MEITVPKYVKTVLKTLSSHGHLACIVGGCVRDMVLNIPPNDWDVSTSALPDEVLELFPNSLTIGMKHGTVTVRVGGKNVEVTTFRSEGEYKDHRHPDTVSFIGDLTTDLSRRDFTINAMAITSDGTIMDPFHGRDDIQSKLIRAVGQASKRFEEDALRMFRAFRFSSRLGFEIEEETFTAIKDNAHLAESLASERVRDEIEKIIQTSSPEAIYTVIDCGLMDKYLDRRLGKMDSVKYVSAVPKKTNYRMAVLCSVLERENCITSTWDFLKDLRFDGRTIRCCSDAVKIAKMPVPEDIKSWKQLLRKYGVDSVECAAYVLDAFNSTNNVETLKSILKSGECFSVHHLAVNGHDLASLGLKGKEIGEMLEFLLDYVIDFPQNNQHDLLMLLCSNSDQ